MIPQVQIVAVPYDVFRKWYVELLLLWVISRVFLQNIYRLPKYQFGSESN